MWYGVREYVELVAVGSFVAHLLSRRYLVVCMVGPALCSVGNIIHESWLADFQVNLRWAPCMFVAGFMLALPVVAVVGLPFVCWRHYTRSDGSDQDD
jgi:hypothetical protein